jgi:aminoglycoside phosphotransferase (APT) family kinase protein
MTDPRLTASATPVTTETSTEGTDRGRAPADRPVPAGIDDAGVSAWFTAHVDGVSLPLDYELIAGGRSNLTFGVTDATGQRYVLRRPPTGHLLPTAHDMGREHRIIAAMGPAGVPVPNAVGYCDDPAVNGAPFYVMDFVDGYILRNEEDVADSPFDLEGRRRLSEALVDTLAGIHALDPDAIGLGDLGRKEGYIARQLRRWIGQYHSSRDDQDGPDVAEIDAVHDRLVTRIPEQGRAGVVHGDYRLDNTIVGADTNVVAVLDWELCTLGDTMADLGQLLVYWTEPGETSALQHSATTAPGFSTRAALAARYAEVSGRSIDQLDFYVAFAYWKVACILEGVYTRYVAGAMGSDGFDFHAYPTMIRNLATQAHAAAERLD